MFRFFKKNKNDFEQIYPELNPDDRIRKIVLEYILPKFEKYGFKLLKSEIILKRDIGNFQQEIYFRKSKWNRTGENVMFDPHFFVKSKEYSKWYKKIYKKKIPNDYRINNFTLWASGKNIPNWGETFNSYDWYNLAEMDNLKLIQEINEKIENVAIPYMNLHSDYYSSIDMIIKRKSFTKTAMMLDFCEILNNAKKANEISFWYQTNVLDKGINLDDDVKKEIEIRRNKIKNWAQQSV